MDPQECVLGSEEVSLIHKSLGGYLSDTQLRNTQVQNVSGICPLTIIGISTFYEKTMIFLFNLNKGNMILCLIENVKT